MGIAINELTIASLLGPGIFELNKDVMEQTKAIAEFCLLLWKPYFLESRVAPAAPQNDLNLWVDLQYHQACFEPDSLQYQVPTEATCMLILL